MKLAGTVIFSFLASTAAFTICFEKRNHFQGLSKLYSDQDAKDLDLDLEEMFTMFEAAEKDEKFDEAIKKVKTSEEK
jgi:hypothetical protein